MNLYLVSVSVRRYDDDLRFYNSFTRRVQVIAPCETDAKFTAYLAIRDVYDKRNGNWTCLPIGAQLLYTNYQIVD